MTILKHFLADNPSANFGGAFVASYVVGSSRYTPDWLCDYISENEVITHKSNNSQLWNSAHVMTEKGFVTANEGDTIVLTNVGTLEVRKKAVPQLNADCMVVHAKGSGVN